MGFIRRLTENTYFKSSLDLEIKSRMEVVKGKKKLEGDINELELSLDHSNR